MDISVSEYCFHEMANEWLLVDWTLVCVPTGVHWVWEETLWLEFGSWGTSCDFSVRDPSGRDFPTESCRTRGHDAYVVLHMATAWEMLVSTVLMLVQKYEPELD